MDAFLRLLVSCHLCTEIINIKRKIWEKSKKSRMNVYVRIAYISVVCMCVFVSGLYLCIVVCSRIYEC